jgi:hypothetical protein
MDVIVPFKDAIKRLWKKAPLLRLQILLGGCPFLDLNFPLNPIFSRLAIFRVRMERAAVRLAKAVNYINAGTVEYLYTAEGEFFFLELNPRLQVVKPFASLYLGFSLLSCPVIGGTPCD